MEVYVTSLTVGGHRVTAVTESKRGVVEHVHSTIENMRADLEDRRFEWLRGAPLQDDQKIRYAEKRVEEEIRGTLVFLGRWLEGGKIESIYSSDSIHLVIEKTFLKP